MASEDQVSVLERFGAAAAAQAQAEASLQLARERLDAALEELRRDEDARAGATLTALASLLQALASSPDHESGIEALAGAAATLLPGCIGALCVHDDDDQLVIAAVWDADGQHWLRHQGEASSLLSEIATRPAAEALRQPCLGLGVNVGELRLWPAAPGSEPALRAAAQLLAAAAGLGLSGLALKRRLAQRTARDALTGLFNRRYMEDTLGRELHRAARHQAGMALILCDIDRLAGFNERWGNETGDRLLQSIGGLLQGAFRGSDVCSRISGQRFAIILPDASLEDGLRRARELCKLAGELRLSRRGEPVDPVTMSAGVAAFPAHARDADALMAAAESALFLAKQQGPGAVACAEKIE